MDRKNKKNENKTLMFAYLFVLFFVISNKEILKAYVAQNKKNIF